MTARSELISDALVLDGAAAPLRFVINPRARRLILKVDPLTGEAVVTAPSRASRGAALAFARRQVAWIAARSATVPPALPFEDGVEFPFKGRLTLITHIPGNRRPATHDPDSDELFVGGAQPHLARRVQDF